MKILLIAINAKYIHSNLAVYCLKAYAEKYAGIRRDSIEIAEYSINQQPEDILIDIYKREPDIIAFSCYIWNLRLVESISENMRKLSPAMPIWVGGPEVSYDAREFLKKNKQITGVILGEGEVAFSLLVQEYQNAYGFEKVGNLLDDFISFIIGKSVIAEENRKDESEEGLQDELQKGIQEKSRYKTLIKIQEASIEKEEKNSKITDIDVKNIKGIAYRKGQDDILINKTDEPLNLSKVPFPYSDLKAFENKIIYYESSRGCPFSCSYCLSSIDKRVRFRDLELVKKELQIFLDANVVQVKFVDRTFNCSHKHAMGIWEYLKEHDNGITNFHFEISADILTEEEIALLQTMRQGLVQLEIGVQSTNPDTIEEIDRTMDLNVLKDKVNLIRKGHNIHQHLDLIAGLPYEDLESFRNSFNEIYELEPNQLQLGFLKVLKGSKMHEKAKEYGIAYNSDPPYEILYSEWLPFQDVIRLKEIEEMVEVYYNSGQFANTMALLVKEFESPFALYESLAVFYAANGYWDKNQSRMDRYYILLDFISNITNIDCELYKEMMLYDLYLRENLKSRPNFAPDITRYKEFIWDFYRQEETERRFLKEYADYNAKQMIKMTHLEVFRYPVLDREVCHKGVKGQYPVLFDYQNRNKFTYDAAVYLMDEICIAGTSDS